MILASVPEAALAASDAAAPADATRLDHPRPATPEAAFRPPPGAAPADATRLDHPHPATPEAAFHPHYAAAEEALHQARGI